PDVIFIGEVRSAAAALVATRAAKTGHLVLTTFHAPSPIEGYAGVAHLMEEKREYDLLQSLVMIISQRLVRKLCEHCRVKRAATEDELGRFEYAMTRLGVDVASLDLPEHLWFAPSEEGNTCEHCKGKGTAGVVPIHGVLDFTPKVRRLLLEGKLSEVEELQAFRLEGQILRKLEVGDISLEEACL
ncbi:TPA: ATPase, T2SS/T4P/T4SS family, partial [Pseudomonas aeruginosa]